MPTIDLTDIHVLIVDDHDDTLDVLSAALQQFGATVLRARTGRAALTIVMTVRVNAIVSDLAMPGEDGLWLVQELRRLKYKGGIIPAIAVTAHSDYYSAEQAKVAGFDALPGEAGRSVRPLQGGGVSRRTLTVAESFRCARTRRRRLGTEAPPDPASEMDDTVIRRGCADGLRGLDRRVADLADGPLVLFHDLDDRTPR